MALPAAERLARLLAVIPWVAARDGVPLEEVSERFSYPMDALLADLNDVLLFVGVYPYTPDTLIEVVVNDGRVWINYADYFAEPMRLDSEQVVALISAGRSMLELMPEEDGPLLRALAKLAAGRSASALDVRLSDEATPTLSLLRQAIETRKAVDISYYSFNRDDRTDRRVEPHRVFAREGHWYLSGYCHSAESQRLFRVDRIDRIDPSGASFEIPVDQEPSTSLPIEAVPLPTLRLRLGAEDRWIATAHPHEVTDDPDVIVLPISAQGWLERLLLRLGPGSSVVEIEPPFDADAGIEAARRIRQRYGG